MEKRGAERWRGHAMEKRCATTTPWRSKPRRRSRSEGEGPTGCGGLWWSMRASGRWIRLGEKGRGGEGRVGI